MSTGRLQGRLQTSGFRGKASDFRLQASGERQKKKRQWGHL
jgi:hypothetical protein